MSWADYWVWFAAAIVLAILEILAPGYILLGFAVAAGIVGVLLWANVGLVSLPVTLVIFGVLALLVWLGLRYAFGNPRGQVKVWDKDINDDL